MSDKYVNPLSAAKLIALVKSAVSGKLDKTGGTITGFLRLKDALYADGSIASDGNLIGKMLQLHTAQSTDDNPVVVDIAPSADDAAALDVVATAESGGLKQGSIIVATPTDSQANYAATVEYVRSKVEDVDAELSDTSEKPVQNKAIKVALDGKLSTRGGDVTGSLSLTRGITVGRTEDDTGIHLYKDRVGVAKMTSGSADADDNITMARLKVASPTEDDDAATKAYVDNNAAGAGAVRYDAAQTLDEAQQFQARKNIGAIGHNSPQFQGFLSLAPANAPLETGVGLSPSRNGNNFALDISDVNENTPTLLTGVKTPTDTDTNAAATVEYVKNKVSEVSPGGGVTVDTAMSDTSTNPVQNKVIKQYVDGHAVSLPLTLTYANGQATGATYTDIRKAIERGSQIKLSVANTPDIIASNARNETNKSVLKFVDTDVGGDTVSISQYTVTAQASGLTCNVKSHELA